MGVFMSKGGNTEASIMDQFKGVQTAYNNEIDKFMNVKNKLMDDVEKINPKIDALADPTVKPEDIEKVQQKLKSKSLTIKNTLNAAVPKMSMNNTGVNIAGNPEKRNGQDGGSRRIKRKKMSMKRH